MKRMLFALLLTGFIATIAQAQDPFGSDPSPSDRAVEQSPELYMMMKMMERYDDPKQAVQRKAAQKAADRRSRMATQKWYGFSPSRPAVSPAFGIGYAQHWVGNGANRYQWVDNSYPVIVRVPTVLAR